MIRIAILGGGISGLTAAYELELARKRGAAIDWHLYEASDRLGGIIETTRHTTPEGDYILEGGPDGWVSEKPWARELAIELGLEDELIYSNDTTRKTYILENQQLLPIPAPMRLMVPEDLSALDNSPLFSDSAKAAYALELTRAAELKTSTPDHDESVASFVLRHFGEEVLTTLAAPLLSGVFGGDVHKLSVRAVMPQFVAMEREHGSLIVALQAKSKRRTAAPQPIFISLRNGVASLIDAIRTCIPRERVHFQTPASSLLPEAAGWMLRHPERSAQRGVEGSLYSARPGAASAFNHILLATSADITGQFLQPLHPQAASLLPTDASSAILVNLAWPAALARTITLPPGFGFLVPQNPGPWTLDPGPSQLLACTFVDQKFPHRAPAGARILRAFFGGSSADALALQPDATIAAAALTQLRAILGSIPNPTHTEVRRLPRSLPQYEVGHLDRIAQLESLVAQIPGLHLLGNAYRGVGLPDLIRDARTSARHIADSLTRFPKA